MNFYEQVYTVVRRIPRGRVTSYGRIAKMLGRPRAARAVGYALNALRDEADHDVPWQRVVNAAGRISIVNREFGSNLQAEKLRDEGIVIDEQLRLVDFTAVLWVGLDWHETEDLIDSNGK